MFTKPFQVKTNCQLKGSARKKFRSDIIKRFPIITEDEFNNFLPNKTPVSVMKIITHSRDIVLVYTMEKGPIAFEWESEMYPALYLLWQFPNLVQTFTTWPKVLDYITNGADLMLPGVILPGGSSINAYGKLQKGDIVAVNLSTNRAPVAVGIAAHSSYDMYMCGGKGKCVNILHFFGDLLCSQGEKYGVPELGPPFELDHSVRYDETSYREDKDENEECGAEQDNNGEISDVANKLNEAKILEPTECDVENSVAENDVIEESESCSMDKLLRFCFLKALKTTARKIELPILTSGFFKVHMLPACPPGQTIDLKKSSYKKLGKFLDEMVAEKIIVQKEMSKGVMSITSINYSHETLLTFLDLDAVVEVQVPAGHAKFGKCMCGVVHSQQVYTVTPAVFPIFKLYSNRIGEQLEPESVRKTLKDYLKTQNLYSDETSPIQCNEILARAILGVSPPEPLILSWEDLLKRVKARMLDVSALPAPKIHKEDKGKLTPIDIQIATRTGNKKVTLVSNLEQYKIDITEFSKECQRGVAASTSTNPLPGRQGVQLQIQGNQINFISKILHEKYKVPMANMRGLDKAPKIKGQKKAAPKPKNFNITKTGQMY